MMSLLQDVARDCYPVVVGFGQVFLACALLVAIAYWLHSRLFPKKPEPTGRNPKIRKTSELRSQRTKARPTYTEIAGTPISAVAVPMPPEAHWQRASAPVLATIARGERARQLHDRALVRLEAADYAFRRLLLELTEVVSTPQDPKPSQPVEQIREAHEDTTRLAA